MELEGQESKCLSTDSSPPQPTEVSEFLQTCSLQTIRHRIVDCMVLFSRSLIFREHCLPGATLSVLSWVPGMRRADIGQLLCSRHWILGR